VREEPKAVVAAGSGGAGGLERRNSRRPKAVVAAGSGGAGGLERRNSRRPKAVVAMSGGVDSSVAAALLSQQGYDVTGIMLKLWRGEADNTNSGCCNLGAADDARRVADVLGIPFYVLNFAERFEDTVVSSFHADYAAGRTPNPCVRCNQWIKFDALLERAEALGADILATGHYARVREYGGRYSLLRGRDLLKDQSYVLWMLTQEKLARARFPVGELEKSETRQLAADLGLRTAGKPDSQEICFVRNGDLGAYVDVRLPEARASGPIVSTDGEIIGEHRGIARYTVGQRKGLGISMGVPVYVSNIDARTNTITVGSRSDLGVRSVVVDEVSVVAGPLDVGRRVLVQHRAHGEVYAAEVVNSAPGYAELNFEEHVEAVAPGQSSAFYDAGDPEVVLGGGIIRSTDREQIGA
jgi:tRNA-uridine 2-sulfurtransferase